MANVVVVGLQWGDEAKGKAVDYLAQDADYVVRYNGGNNAGHTVVVHDEVYKFHLVPVGVLHEKVTPVVADGVVLDPGVLLQEIDGLNSRGVSVDKLKISGSAHVIMPYHKLLDELEEDAKGDRKIGTTGRGIGPCYVDKVARTGIRINEFIDPDRFRTRLSEALKMKNRIITRVYDADPLDENAVYEEYSQYAQRIAPFVADTARILYDASQACADIVFEGANGSLLDIDYGTYPFVTSSHTVAGGACIGTGVPPRMIEGVIGVTKAYTTRVGRGPCPTELDDEVGERIRKQGNEYGTTTGRPRRCGWFDSVIVRYTARLNGIRCIALTLLDVLTGFDVVKICTHYVIDGREVRDLPSDPYAIENAVPVYEEMPGWTEDITGITAFSELPSQVRHYVNRITELVEAPVCLISVGPRRDQTIITNSDMLKM